MQETFKQISNILESYSWLGREVTPYGTTLIGKAPHIAPMAWLHTIYKPLKEEEIISLEMDIGYSIPKSIKDFLKCSNGLNVFNTDFYIYGKRGHYKRDANSAWLPFSVIRANVDERISDSKNNFFYIGGYSWDGSKLYIDSTSGIVYRCERYSSRPLNKWNNLEEMLITEINRLVNLFNERGVKINDAMPTPPPINRSQ